MHLTTHRLLFHALLPPDSSFANPHPTAEGAEGYKSDIVMSGPVTMHRSSPLKPPKRLWMEITLDMITTYPKGDEVGRVRPLRSILREC